MAGLGTRAGQQVIQRRLPIAAGVADGRPPTRLLAGRRHRLGDLHRGQTETAGKGFGGAGVERDARPRQALVPQALPAREVRHYQRHVDHTQRVAARWHPSRGSRQHGQASGRGQRVFQALELCAALLAPQRVDPLQAKRRVVQPGLAEGQLERLIETHRGFQGLGQLDYQHLRADLAGQRLGQRQPLGAARPVQAQDQRPALLRRLERHRPQRRGDLAPQRQVVQCHGRLHGPAEGRQPPVQPVVAQQEGHDLVVQLEVVRQQGRLDVAGVRDQLDDVVAQQGGVGGKVGCRGDLLLDRGAKQRERQADRWPLLGHVVLEVGVEPLVAQVQLGRQGQQYDVNLKVVEAVHISQVLQTQCRARGIGRLDQSLHLLPGAGPRLVPGALLLRVERD